MRLWFASLGLLFFGVIGIGVTALRVAGGTLQGASSAWVAAVLGLASLVVALLSLRRRVD